MEKVCKKEVRELKEELGFAESAAGKKKEKVKSKKDKKDKAKDDDQNMSDDNTKGAAADSDDEDEVSFEEKVAFTEKVRRLTNQGLTRLVCKVKDCCKEALEDVDEEKLQI